MFNIDHFLTSEHFKQRRFQQKIGPTPCTATFYYTNEKTTTLDLYAEFVFDVWATLLPMAKGRCPALTADLYLTKFRKELPHSGAALGPDQINTGMTSECGNITVYRKEEWPKVLIHETIHTLRLDSVARQPPTHSTAEQEGLYKFPWAPGAFSLAEVFAEVWARLLNCAFVAQQKQKPFDDLLRLERVHAVKTMVRVLAYNGLTYADLLAPTYRALPYKENTNVFSYVVLTALLLNYPDLKMTTTTPEMIRQINAVRTSPAFIDYVGRIGASKVHGPLRMSAARIFSST
jgi:hypothetical protein